MSLPCFSDCSGYFSYLLLLLMQLLQLLLLFLILFSQSVFLELLHNRLVLRTWTFYAFSRAGLFSHSGCPSCNPDNGEELAEKRFLSSLETVNCRFPCTWHKMCYLSVNSSDDQLLLLLLLLLSLKYEVMFSGMSVCLSVSLFVHYITQKLWTDFDETLGLERGTRTNWWLDFDADSNHNPDRGIF